MNRSVEIVRSAEGLASLEQEWSELLARQPKANPFLAHAWARAWMETLGAKAELLVVVVRADERVCAIAPLCIQPGGVLTFIGYPQSDYADLLLDEGAEDAVPLIVQAIYGRRREWRRACLDQMHEEQSHWPLLEAALRTAGHPFRIEIGDYCPAMSLEDPGAAKKQYYKKNINNYVNWYGKQGEFRFESYDDPVLAAARLEDLFAQHIERWNGTPTPSSFLRPQMKDFYRRFLAAMHPAGTTRFFALRLDDQFLALYLCLESNDTLYMYKPTYNVAYYSHSPGQVILRYLFDYAQARGLIELDYGRGDEGYKERFSNLSRRSRRILLYENVLMRGRAELRHRLRYSRPVEALLRRPRIRALLERLRG